jgi:hypothetical protein
MIEKKETIYLIPELARLTGMGDKERTNTFLMKKLASETKM